MEEIKENAVENTADGQIQSRKGNVLDMFRSPSLRRRSFLLIVTWFTVSAAFYGLAFNISYLFGDKYVNFAISEAVDMCAVLIMLWAVPRFGRRKPLALAYLICGIANVIAVITTAIKSDAIQLKILGTATALLGKSAAMSILNTLNTFTTELYPTVVRNVSLGVNSLWTRIGGMLSAQIFLLGMYTTIFVPYVILGVLALTSVVLILLLPETHNRSLMDTIEPVRQKCVVRVKENDEKSSSLIEEREAFVHQETSL